MILYHLANALFLLSYIVKDILWLRIITVLAGLTVLLSLFVQPQPSPASIAWNLLFFGINLVRIYLLIRERRPVPLSGDEQHVANLVFRTLRPRELVRLLRVGAFVEHAPGTKIVTRGEKLAHLLLVVRGNARVELDHNRSTNPSEPAASRVVIVADGTFIGELGYLTGKPPGADVVAVSPLCVMQWPIEPLREFLDDNPELQVTMQQVLGADLAAKLRGG